MNCIICLKIGSLYSADYVNNLYHAIRKFTNDDFICFTDDSSGIESGVICYDMFPKQCDNWKHLWCKIMMYGRDEIKKYRKKIIQPVIWHQFYRNPKKHVRLFGHKKRYLKHCLAWRRFAR